MLTELDHVGVQWGDPCEAILGRIIDAASLNVVSIRFQFRVAGLQIAMSASDVPERSSQVVTSPLIINTVNWRDWT
jgi:hypothetical protein